MVSFRVALCTAAAGAAVGALLGLGLRRLCRAARALDAEALQIYNEGLKGETRVTLYDVLAAVCRHNAGMAPGTRVDPATIGRVTRELKPSLKQIAAMSRSFDLSVNVWQAIADNIELEKRTLTANDLDNANPTLVLCMVKRLVQEGRPWDIIM
jgi:hypothetical protein